MTNSCIKCGYCIEHCPQKAIFVNQEGKIDINRNLCNTCLECEKFCYAKALQPVAVPMTVEEIMKEVRKDKGFYDNTGGGMTISGGEMLTKPEFVEALIKAAKEEGINVCLDTSGYGDGEKLEKLASYDNVTNILYDMKAIDNQVHLEYVGKSNELILDNLKTLATNPVTKDKIFMRMPIIKGVNDSKEIIDKTIEFYSQNSIKALTLLPYHNLGISKKRNIGGSQEVFETPSDQFIEELKERFEKEAGMNVEILGKV